MSIKKEMIEELYANEDSEATKIKKEHNLSRERVIELVFAWCTEYDEDVGMNVHSKRNVALLAEYKEIIEKKTTEKIIEKLSMMYNL